MTTPTVTVLTVGPEQATDAIRKALQMGADKGVHVVDDAIAGSDALATSLVLAEAVKKIERRPGRVRHGLHRRRPWAWSRRCSPSASASRRSPSARRSSVEGDDGHGSAATATPPPRPSRAPLPLVLSVTDQSGEARYPSFKGIMAAKKKPLETWSLADLGVDADAGRPRRPPGPRSRAPRPARRAPRARSSPTRTARAPLRWSSSSRRRSSSETG